MKKTLKKWVLLSLSSTFLLSISQPIAIFAEEATETEEVVEESVEETEEAAEEEAEVTEESDAELPTITKKELAEANGKDGNPAYIAVFGKVYDVTDVEAWAEGEHNGVMAGTDGTSAFIGESPHDASLLEGLTAVATFADWELTTDQLAEFGPDNEATPNLIAVRGIVYDVTDNEAWPEGEHNGVVAGTDATEAFANSPHEDELLEGLTAVGRHIDFVFDADTLSQYDGKDGNKAYIAVDGVVYDVSNYDAWPEGEHNGVVAGTDATEAFSESSPHTEEFLAELPIVGRFE